MHENTRTHNKTMLYINLVGKDNHSYRNSLLFYNSRRGLSSNLEGQSDPYAIVLWSIFFARLPVQENIHVHTYSSTVTETTTLNVCVGFLPICFAMMICAPNLAGLSYWINGSRCIIRSDLFTTSLMNISSYFSHQLSILMLDLSNHKVISVYTMGIL